MKNGIQQQLLEAGALFKPCFCGPCFGAGDVPANNGLSIRHTTRNFPNREGSRPGDGQLSAVVLMDARSIAATARNHGVLTAATELDYTPPAPHREAFDGSVYEKRCYFGFGKAEPDAPLRLGPNITEWPKIPALAENLFMSVKLPISMRPAEAVKSRYLIVRSSSLFILIRLPFFFSTIIQTARGICKRRRNGAGGRPFAGRVDEEREILRNFGIKLEAVCIFSAVVL